MAKSETTEPTVESLQQELAEKSADLLEKQTALDAATAQLAQGLQNLEQVASRLNVAQAQLEQSQAELTAKLAELAEAQSIIEGQALTIQELQNKVKTVQANPDRKPSFEYGGSTYEVHAASFRMAGEVYTREELLDRTDLQALCIEKRFGFIVKIDA